MTPSCPLCGPLRDKETSYAKYGAPENDRPLPAEAARLTILPELDNGDSEKRHARRCPACGTLYAYLSSHEYMVNGSEEEEELTRLQPAEADAFLHSQALLLERLRREIDDLQGEAGRLGDYIDRGRPEPGEAAAAFDGMQELRRQADALRLRLQGQVQELRSACPEILDLWSAAHARVCLSFLETLPDAGEDALTARFAARSALEAWQRLAQEGEAFIAVCGNWLPGYLERLDGELAAYKN